jgi:hypothetical protein
MTVKRYVESMEQKSMYRIMFQKGIEKFKLWDGRIDDE